MCYCCWKLDFWQIWPRTLSQICLIQSDYWKQGRRGGGRPILSGGRPWESEFSGGRLNLVVGGRIWTLSPTASHQFVMWSVPTLWLADLTSDSLTDLQWEAVGVQKSCDLGLPWPPTAQIGLPLWNQSDWPERVRSAVGVRIRPLTAQIGLSDRSDRSERSDRSHHVYW